MSMRPTPLPLCARAETLMPTPAGMLSPLFGATIVTLGPDTMNTERMAVSAAPAPSVAPTTTTRLSTVVSAGFVCLR